MYKKILSWIRQGSHKYIDNKSEGKVDGSKEIHIIWSIQVTVFHNGPWVSTDHPVR